ncbi:uroporphyrinogen-III C-methyltransferase [Archaeoglobales archaeon]|nr:MAG: uroporphyrinogen-III C-methyltransferase [Archaeoglobales archaeon]
MRFTGNKECKVYIVGAGPGKLDLLTKRAEEVIKQADVILYDELIGEVRDLVKTKADAILVDVGKRSGKHKKSQEEINQLILDYAKKGYKVVRLKGGDPFIFGRGGEEAEFLAEHGVKFEVVSGITSAIAVPTKAAIPLTHRNFDPALVFITGREAKERINWGALAKLNATIVILMGVGKLEENCKKLIQHGKSPETPVAIIEKGFSGEERVIVGNLENIGDIAKKENVKPPAIVVVGEVVRLRDKLKDFLCFMD